MLKISKQQALNRWDTLPENLREAIFDEHNADIVWKFGKANHLSDGKIKQIAGVAGDVIMGFMHPDIDEIAKEIQESAGVPKELALEAAKELEKKILLKLKPDLEKIYAPPRDEEKGISSAPNSRAKLATGQASSEDKHLEPVKIAVRKPEGSEEVKQETSKEVEPPANLPFASKDLESFELEKKGPEITQPSKETKSLKKEAKSPAAGEDKPFLLHKEKPLFTPTHPPEKPSVAFRPEGESGKPVRQKPVSAKVSLPVAKEDNPQRVVHYSDLSTKLEK